MIIEPFRPGNHTKFFPRSISGFRAEMITFHLKSKIWHHEKSQKNAFFLNLIFRPEFLKYCQLSFEVYLRSLPVIFKFTGLEKFWKKSRKYFFGFIAKNNDLLGFCRAPLASVFVTSRNTLDDTRHWRHGVTKKFLSS